MDTSQIKRFAVEARNILKQGVINRIAALGFNDKGEVEERNKPQRLQGNTLFMGQLYDENFYGKWMALYNRVQTKGIKEVYEETAYTWFNRLMAIRIMEKNGFTEPVLAFDDDRFRIPRIVSNARAGQFYVDASEREKLSELLIDDTKTPEQFTLLITSFCHTNPVINNCFGGVSDYTEILLPTNILSEGGFVDMLNHTAFITDDDYRQSELIGWLYQFYISEKKDEVFDSYKKGKKAEAEDIPAATQIFTPNWIVKYMVQNTVGRIFLDNNPDSDLKENWKYLVEPSSTTPDDCIFNYDDPKELTIADFGCGSGHILNEGFDILYDIYIDEGYSRKQAVENIFKYNLTGVDIDTRAKQLATFALMMKACQKDDSFLDCHVMPNVLDMPEPIEALNKFFGCFMHDMVHSNAMVNAVKLCQQANNLGSIMKFDITEKDRKDLYFCINRWYEEHEIHEFNNNPNDVKTAKLILALTNEYASVVMNPPYMGSGNMNAELSAYVQENYPEGKADLATVFIQVMQQRAIEKGMYGYIIPPSWMFLSTFEALRRNLIDKQSIQSVLHLSRGVFGADFGAVASVIKNKQDDNAKGTYFRLVERTFQEFEQDHLRVLFEKTLADHSFKYYFKDYTKDDPKLYHSDNGNRVYYPNVSQKNFEKIPGCPIGYWVSERMVADFDNDKIGDIGEPKSGIMTGNSPLYVKLFYEVSVNNIGFNLENSTEIRLSGKRWFPIVSGGSARRWYGNLESVVNLYNDGEDIINNVKNYRLRDSKYYFKESITWPKICSGYTTFRLCPQGVLFGDSGLNLFLEVNIQYYLGLMNSKIVAYVLKLINPTFNNQVSDIGSIPVIESSVQEIESIVQSNISISKQDWDAHETSWDFETNELLKIDDDTYRTFIDAYEDEIRERNGRIDGDGCLMEALVECYKEKWEENFRQLHHNEEELNRQFIEIYGLQDELTPDVPMDEITILQQGEISVEDNQIVWNNDVIIKQLISYTIGCMMGRYRMDQPGLWIAHQNPTSDEICTYHYNGENYTIDDDGIMPLMSRDCGFDDNGVLRFTEFLRVAFGEKCLTENLNYVEECLGKTIEDYLKKDFWKDHKKMYQNRPIYWLFSSKKGAFQVLAYMHRMNPYTVEQIRNKYLLPHIEYLNGRIAEMEVKEAALSTSERRTLSKLKENLTECQEYHERLHLVADQQIAFDLDDGVVVNYAKFGDVVAKIK